MSDSAKISVTSGSTTSTSSRANNDAYTNICPDGHACDNDATCVESLLQENKYVCDCSDAYKQTGRVYAGLSCQHVATEYCTLSGELSQTSYCVNEGVCSSKVEPTAPHPGCNCPTHYSGAHCQFISGSEPIETSYFLDGTTYAAMYRDTEGPGINPAAIVLPILFVTLGAVGYFLWRYRGFNLSGIAIGGKDHVVDKTKKADENMLEADGTSLSTSMSQIGSNPKLRRNSTPAFSSTHKAALMDPPDFEDLLEQSDHVAFHMDPTGTATHKMFASDPTLNYVATTSSSGSGSSGNSPTNNYAEEYDVSTNQVFEEYDPKDFTTQDFTTSPTSSSLHHHTSITSGTAQDYITSASNPYQSSSHHHHDYTHQDYTTTTTNDVGAFTYGDVMNGTSPTYGGGVTDFGDTKDPSLT